MSYYREDEQDKTVALCALDFEEDIDLHSSNILTIQITRCQKVRESSA